MGWWRDRVVRDGLMNNINWIYRIIFISNRIKTTSDQPLLLLFQQFLCSQFMKHAILPLQILMKHTIQPLQIFQTKKYGCWSYALYGCSLFILYMHICTEFQLFMLFCLQNFNYLYFFVWKIIVWNLNMNRDFYGHLKIEWFNFYLLS